MVTHQLQVRCRPVKVRRSETDVLPLSHPTKVYKECTGCVLCVLGVVYHIHCRVKRRESGSREMANGRTSIFTAHGPSEHSSETSQYTQYTQFNVHVDAVADDFL